MPFFSIVVPLYNKQKDIKETLLSALNQTFVDFELIVINDGSTDDSEAEVLSITDGRLAYQKTKNQGVSAARNLGIEIAKGEYIAFLDADDYWYPNHLETLKNLTESFPHAGAVAANYEFKHPNGTVTNTSFKDIDTDFKGIVKDFFKSSMLFRLMWTSAVAVKKDVFLNIGMFDINITLGAGEDTDMWTRIALKYPVAFNAKITASYNLGASNRISHSQTLKRKYTRVDKFYKQEADNTSLKKFNDLYRSHYALKHKLAGDSNNFKFYFKHLDFKRQPLKTKLLLLLPATLLRLLYKIKARLKSKDIHFDIYN